MKFEKGSAEFNFFADFYKFCEKWYKPATPNELYDMEQDRKELKKKYRDTSAKVICSWLTYAFCKMQYRIKEKEYK